jgi:Mg-chelatase subunit ChlD
MRLPKPDKAATATILATSAMVIAGAFLLSSRGTAAVRPQAPDPVQVEQSDRPQVDVVFALDTTGSMSGMIESAKQKIWSIANNVVAAQPRPEVRFGLVFYRDKTDAYVTDMVPLTDDIDGVYDRLLGAAAAGGGDGPEHVNAALDQAINKMGWRQGDNVLRLVFLVGDAPPHDDYTDTPTSTELARQARDKGIIINTVRAGWDAQTEVAWKRIAEGSGGAFASIQQDGGTVAVTTPYDEELARYNDHLAEGSVGWGDADRRRRAEGKFSNRKAMKGEVAAAAASVAGARGGYLGEDDFVSAVDTGKVKLEKLDPAALPPAIKGKPLAEQQAWIADKKAKRAAISTKIVELAKKRNRYLKDQAAEAPADSFDNNVNGMLKRQAGKVGIKME